jgi:hypothetical protein
MIMQKRLIRVGHSIGFLIDKRNAEILKLRQGDMMEITIKKLSTKTTNHKKSFLYNLYKIVKK